MEWRPPTIVPRLIGKIKVLGIVALLHLLRKTELQSFSTSPITVYGTLDTKETGHQKGHD
jgi:hypothetical protein